MQAYLTRCQNYLRQQNNYWDTSMSSWKEKTGEHSNPVYASLGRLMAFDCRVVGSHIVITSVCCGCQQLLLGPLQIQKLARSCLQQPGAEC